tara:strand:+ start:1132 stop:1419 length:288 start_codon:yes stop_codon:yes gene_type:complete
MTNNQQRKENKMPKVYDNNGDVIEDPREMRFSKAKVWACIEQYQQFIEQKFLSVERKKLDDQNGTAQCATQEGLEFYNQWRMLEYIGERITNQHQ